MYQPLKKQRLNISGRGWGSKGEAWEEWRKRKRGRSTPGPIVLMGRAFRQSRPLAGAPPLEKVEEGEKGCRFIQSCREEEVDGWVGDGKAKAEE